MVDSLRLVRGAWIVMAVLLALLLLEVSHWRRDAAYNDALHRQDYERAAQVAVGARATAARAHATPDARFEDKVMLLSGLSEGGSVPGDALYNLANLYMRRALTLDAEEDRDILVPLVEQAKQHYRTVLASRPGDWDAKFNLELALTVLPEVPAEEADEEFNPERSERAISKMRVEEQLP